MKKETIELIEKIKIDLKDFLSEFRYNHSIGVMNKAIELAKIYGEDEDKAALAGITHDIAKEISNEEAFEIAKHNNIILDEIQKRDTRLLHGIIGAIIVKEKYGFDEQIQNAIKYHTAAYYNMDMLAKIIYVADKIEETRKPLEKLEIWREMAKTDIDKTIILIINFVTERIIEENGLIHPTMIETRNYLLMKRKN